MQNIFNVNVVKPNNEEELKVRYTEAVFKIIKNALNKGLSIERVIEKLECHRSDDDENSCNIQQKI